MRFFTSPDSRSDARHPKHLALRQVLSVRKTRLFPTWKQWEHLPQVLNKQEKKRFIASLLLFVVSAATLAGIYAVAHHVEIPTTGGQTTEALIGSPRLINPLYASANDADADLAALIFSGLIKWDPVQGYVNDLAASSSVSEDGLKYTYTLHANAMFSNGEPLRARDVVFTYLAIQDPAYRSPIASQFQDVSIEQTDDQSVSFTLKTPNPTFPHALTVGILPESLWADVLPQNAPLASLNLQPIGSGPYEFQEFTKDKKGAIKTYTLKRNTHYYATEPKIDRFVFKFYADAQAASQALINKNVEGAGYIDPEHQSTIENNRASKLVFASIPRSVVLYFNPQQPQLANKTVRTAIAQAIDKTKIIQNALGGHGSVLQGPLMRGTPSFDESFTGIAFDPAAATSALDNAGFTKPAEGSIRIIPSKDKKTTEGQAAQSFTLRLVTTEGNEYAKVVSELKYQLELLGIATEITTVPVDHLISEIITPQAYDLLVTAVYGATDPDPYYFWHSSQIAKGALNVTRYRSAEADTLLEKAREAKTEAEQTEAYRQFQTLLVKDLPALFLYQSEYVFAEPKTIKFSAPPQLRIPSDRFANVTDWYIKTKQTLR